MKWKQVFYSPFHIKEYENLLAFSAALLYLHITSFHIFSYFCCSLVFLPYTRCLVLKGLNLRILRGCFNNRTCCCNTHNNNHHRNAYDMWELCTKEEERIKKSLNKMIITIGKKELKYNKMISEESFWNYYKYQPLLPAWIHFTFFLPE